MKALVLWSGGIESTSVLKWLLETTDYKIHAHKIHFDNPERREPFEMTAINALLPKMRAIRDFTFDTSTVSLCEGKLMVPDRDLYHMLGVQIMLFHECDTMFKGYCAEDQWSRLRRIRDGKTTNEWKRHDSLEDSYNGKAEPVKFFLPPDKKFEDVIKIYESAYWPKAAHYKFLGDMADLTWSCRRPVAGKHCKICHSCIERWEAKQGRSAIPEVQEKINAGLFSRLGL